MDSDWLHGVLSFLYFLFFYLSWDFLGMYIFIGFSKNNVA